MRINLWYSEHSKQWRWTLTYTKSHNEPMDQESGSRPYLRDAMQDIANTVEYLIAKNK